MKENYLEFNKVKELLNNWNEVELSKGLVFVGFNPGDKRLPRYETYVECWDALSAKTLEDKELY